MLNPLNSKKAPQGAKTTSTTTTTTTKTLKGTPKKKSNMDYIIYGVGALAALLVIGLIAYMLMTPSAAEKQAAIEKAKKAERVATTPEPAKVEPPPYLASLGTNPAGWYFQQQPIDALIDSELQKAVANPSISKGGVLTSANGATAAPGSADYNAITSVAKNNTKAALAQKYRTEPRGAYQQIYHRDPTTNEFVPIVDPNQVVAMEGEIGQMLTTEITNGLNTLQPPKPEPVKEQPKPQVINMTEEQKERYKALIDTQRDWNKKLQSENDELKRTMAQQEKGVSGIIQKLEDSPNANKNLRATMLPKSTGLKVEAVVGNRAWLKNSKTGELYSVEVGSVVPGTQLRVGAIDEGTNLVMVTPK